MPRRRGPIVPESIDPGQPRPARSDRQEKAEDEHADAYPDDEGSLCRPRWRREQGDRQGDRQDSNRDIRHALHDDRTERPRRAHPTVTDKVGARQFPEPKGQDVVEKITFIDGGKGPPIGNLRAEQGIPSSSSKSDTDDLKQVGRDEEGIRRL
jgi:hypothetical protein